MIVKVSDLDICIFTILDGVVYMMQDLLDTATSTRQTITDKGVCKVKRCML